MPWRAYPDFTRETKAKRRRRLLAEFLQERLARKQANSEQETSCSQNQVTLPYDLLFKICILVPAEYLYSLQFVCKVWFRLINSPVFVHSHSNQSETVLVCKRLALLRPSHYNVNPPGFVNRPRSYFHFLDLNRGDNNFIESSIVELSVIRACYDGLILATVRNRKGMVLMNPVTRKHIVIHLGTEDDIYGESFGITSCNRTYRVVRLFRGKSGPLGCMILDVSARKWTRIEGPRRELLVDMGRSPVSVSGSLNWMSSRQECGFFVSMNADNGKFVSKKLPVSSSSVDKLLEIGGALGFVQGPRSGLLQVWILIGDENWIRKCSINTSGFPDAFPICCSTDRKGIVLEAKNNVYDYNLETGEKKLIQSRSGNDVRTGRLYKQYIAHRNTLASWEDNLEVM